MREKKLLYRSRNYKDKQSDYSTSLHYRFIRNTKKPIELKKKMKGCDNGGRDYTPLFKFLLSKVGQKWDSVYSEAKSRLDTDAPIFYMVSLNPEETNEVVHLGDTSYYSQLHVDENGILKKVNPNFNVENFRFNEVFDYFTITFNSHIVNRINVVKPDKDEAIQYADKLSCMNQRIKRANKELEKCDFS